MVFWLLDELLDVVERMLEGVLDWLLLSEVFGLLLLDWVLERVDWLLEESVFEELIDEDVEGVLLFVVDEDSVREEEALH